MGVVDASQSTKLKAIGSIPISDIIKRKFSVDDYESIIYLLLLMAAVIWMVIR
jgi:hypothetical protein